MKSLAWIEAENTALVAAAAKRRTAALRRLKQRIARILRDHGALDWDVKRAIDAWDAAERRRAK